jgi:hypothetical protein
MLNLTAALGANRPPRRGETDTDRRTRALARARIILGAMGQANRGQIELASLAASINDKYPTGPRGNALDEATATLVPLLGNRVHHTDIFDLADWIIDGEITYLIAGGPEGKL